MRDKFEDEVKLTNIPHLATIDQTRLGNATISDQFNNQSIF